MIQVYLSVVPCLVSGEHISYEQIPVHQQMLVKANVHLFTNTIQVS